MKVYTFKGSNSVSHLFPPFAMAINYERKESVVCIWRWLNGWMTCDFKPFLTVFQSYQDDGWVIMKDCVQHNSVYDLKDLLPQVGSKLGTNRSVGQHLID